MHSKPKKRLRCDVPEIFCHPGCCSGRCIRRAIADKDRIILCLSSPDNAKKERKEHDALVLEYDRQMEEMEIYGVKNGSET